MFGELMSGVGDLFNGDTAAPAQDGGGGFFDGLAGMFGLGGEPAGAAPAGGAGVLASLGSFFGGSDEVAQPSAAGGSAPSLADRLSFAGTAALTGAGGGALIGLAASGLNPGGAALGGLIGGGIGLGAGILGAMNLESLGENLAPSPASQGTSHEGGWLDDLAFAGTATLVGAGSGALMGLAASGLNPLGALAGGVIGGGLGLAGGLYGASRADAAE